MEVLKNKWIIYDGNCGLCLNSKQLLVRLGVFPDAKCLNYHQLDEGLFSKVDPEHFSYEMALVDEKSDDTLYGLEGILAIFSEKVSWLKLIKKGGLIYMFLEFFYHTVSYNRYFLFPKKKAFSCDCDPPFIPRYFWRWIGLSIAISSMVSYLLGFVAAPLFSKEPLLFGLETLAIVGAGWLFQSIIAVLVFKKKKLRDYARHLSFIALVGVLVLVPSILLSTILPEIYLQIALITSVVISSTLMLRMHIKRVRFMMLPQAWTISWFLSLQLTAICFAYHFKILQL